MRLSFVVLTLAVAALVPYFSLFMSLIGNIGSSALMFILPTIFHIKVRGGSRLKRGLHSLLVIFGIIAAIIGTYVTVVTLVDKFSSDSKMQMGGDDGHTVVYECGVANGTMAVPAPAPI